MVKRTALLLLLALLMMTISAAECQSRTSISPLNPKFTSYLNSRAAVTTQTQTADGHILGFVPPPIALPHSGADTFQSAAPLSLPTSYDLRTQGKLTAVRDQGSCGSCWSFATVGSLESDQLPVATYDFSENHLKDKAGFYYACCDGGHQYMSMAYLARWDGPVYETDDPYNSGSCTSPSGLSARNHVQKVILLPDKTSPTDNNAIKQAVMTYGAVYTAFQWDDTAYNSTNYAYCYSGSASGNHAVCIVGWDDNFDKSKFPNSPAGNGAYIIRNSWGSSWGDNGYFYCSYYDSLMGGNLAVFVNADSNTNYTRNYQYDPYGWTNSLGYNTTTGWFANVFTAAASEDIAAAGFYVATAPAPYEIYVYTNPSGGPINSSGYAYKGTGMINDAGYVTVPFTTPVTLTSGQKFSVAVKLTTPGNDYPIPIEGPVSGYSPNATASAGQSYDSDTGSTWTDVTTDNANTNVCLKAFAQPTPAGLSATPSTSLTPSGQIGGPFSPSSAVYTLTNSSSSGISWTASKTQNWVDLSATSGTLAANGSTNVTVSINSAASGLAIGSYSDTVTFTNVSTGSGNTTRGVQLTVTSPPGLTVTPATDLTSSGIIGGPFSPSSAVYTLTNASSSTISWTASKAQSWTTLSSTSGSLGAGNSTSVTVSINSNANSLTTGNYSDTVAFTNTTTGYGNTTRAVQLAVSPSKSPLWGVDVSKYQGTINWDSLKAATDFAIIRSSYGCPSSGETVSQYTDSQFAANQAGARRVGILRGYYHFAYPQYNTPQCEATQFLNVVGPLQAGEVLCLDFEESYSDPVTWCKQFLDAVRAATGCSPYLYINYSNETSHDWSPVVNAGYPLWLADWDNITTPGVPSTQWTPAWTIKQYGSAGNLGGLTGVDGDIFNGNASQFQALAGIVGISGTVTNTLGTAISGATVSTSTGSYTATTAADGTYKIIGVTPGTYSVTASATGYISQTVSSVVVTAPNMTTANFSLSDARGLAVTPAASFTSSGTTGGPFSPSSTVYTLTNNNSSSISWTASKTQSWVTLSATSGSLGAGASTSVTVSINSNANSLAAGNYSDTVTFTNTTNGNGNTTRGVQLSITSLSSPIYGVDLSKTNGTVNWDTLKAATSFAIMRSSFGCPDAGQTVAQYTDTQFAANQAGARRVGILRGYYHYAYPDYNSDPTCEATQFLNTVGTLQPGEILCLDYERSYSTPVTWCKGFLDKVRSVTGLSPVLHITYSTETSYDWSPVKNAGYPLWLTNLDGSVDPSTPATIWSPYWTIKQYGSGSLGGLTNVNLDAFNGTSVQFQALAGIVGISGKVTNPLGVGISGATVSTSTGSYTATTASDGTYSIIGVTPGTYSVTASATGYTSQTVSSVVVTAPNMTTTNITLPDATTPSQPVVADAGAYQTGNSSLHFSWTASDSQSGIAAYQYAISTTTSTSNIISGGNWLNVGSAAQDTRTGLNLANGQIYYALVQAQNGSGLWSPIGSSDGIRIAKAEATIGAAKAETDNTFIALTGKIVTASLPTSLYMEEPNRSGGIMMAAAGPAEGSIINVAGYISTSSGERQLSGYAADTVSSGTVPKPISLPNKWLGGGQFNSLTPGATGELGLNNIGLLVTTWGYVNSVQSSYFMMSDNTASGVQVVIPSGVTIPNLQTGKFVIATGISSLNNGAKVLKIRKQTDVDIKN